MTFLLYDVPAAGAPGTGSGPGRGASPVGEEVIAEAVAAHRGLRPPPAEGEGADVCAFSRPSDAVAAAIEVQRVLAATWAPGQAPSEPPLRMALHVGEVELRPDGGYFGATVDRCRRMLEAAHGGQILVSAAVADLVIDRLPPGVVLRDFGFHRLRDLGRAERLLQVCHPNLAADFPPLRSLDATPNNLPTQLSTFVGRGREIDQLQQLLESARLLTLTGPGGCGKTRLALQVAARQTARRPDGVWLVELAAASSGDGVVEQLAKVLDVRPDARGSVIPDLERHLRSRRALLVLDNCEHVLDSVAVLADGLLRACPGLTLLATSRQPLAVEGEVTWRVPPLDVPEVMGKVALDSLRQYDAARLFVERAVHARPDFVVNNDSAPAVAEICHRLDGIPLAIELAAARVRMMTPAQIAEGLNDRFRLLIGGHRAAVARQRTLAASVDWSYSLLSDIERTVLRRLSAFHGGFDLDGAQEVCSGDGIEAHQVLPALSGLVDQSLVHVDDRHGGARYQLLETIAEYGSERLRAEGEVESVRRRHFAFFRGLVESQDPAAGLGDSTALATIDREWPNIRAALEWASPGEQDQEAMDLIGMLGGWGSLRPYRDPIACFRRCVGAARSDATTPRSRALLILAHITFQGGDTADAIADARQLLDVARSLDDPDLVGETLTELGLMVALLVDAEEGRAMLDEAVALARAHLDPGCLIAALLNRAYPDIIQDRHDEARSFIEEGSVLAHGVGDRTWDALAPYSEAMRGRAQGDLQAVAAAANEGLVAARAVGDSTHEANYLFLLGWYHAATGQVALALGVLDGAEDRFEHIGGVAARPKVLLGRAYAAAASGDLNVARGSASTAAAHFQELHYDFFQAESTLLAATLALAEEDFEVADRALASLETISGRLGNGRLQPLATLLAAWRARSAKEGEQAESLCHQALAALMAGGSRIGAAEALELLGLVAADRGSHVEAVRLLAAAVSDRSQMGLVPYPHEALRTARTSAHLRHMLGDEVFDAAWAEGTALPLADAVALVQRARGERRRPSLGWASLTPTERSIVDLVVQGLTNPEIGQRLFITRGTVKTHLAHIFAKLDVRSRADLAARAAVNQVDARRAKAR